MAVRDACVSPILFFLFLFLFVPKAKEFLCCLPRVGHRKKAKKRKRKGGGFTSAMYARVSTTRHYDDKKKQHAPKTTDRCLCDPRRDVAHVCERTRLVEVNLQQGKGAGARPRHVEASKSM